MHDDDAMKKMGAVSGGGDTDEDPWKDVRQEMRERFELLPKEIQSVLTSEEYERGIFELAKEQKLTYEEMGILEVETSMVLLGMTRPADYRDELQVQLKKNDPDIDTLVAAINTQVFDPVRSAIQKVFEAKKDPEDYLTEETPKVPQTGTPSRVTPPASAQPAVSVWTPKPAPTLSSAEKSVLASTGVVINDTPASSFQAQPTAMPSRTDVLKGIENPPKAAPVNIVADKLKTAGPVISSTKTTDYSLPKVTPTAPVVQPATRPGVDPYREPIN